ncbi:unnamed protein product [Porites evermanni]|uniref:Uncharacterized protein n=1 Tax=Porites evermanni TaxID=104178 RepID=A0ABN8RFY0_9CNID|nr:unnamed protein product [Porites evermanni]
MKIAKLKDCEALPEWVKPCERHLHWSATSTFRGNGRVILVTFKGFLNHVINKHSGFSDPLFNKCANGNVEPRKWLRSGMTLVYEKLCEALSNKALVRGIKQASPHSQTSCLEGFHSVLNHFAPKMIAYSYVGMYCRHILAAVHFNFNPLVTSCTSRTNLVKVSYPKFKNGEATVRDVRVEPTLFSVFILGNVEEIFQTYMNASKDELKNANTSFMRRPLLQ